MVTVVEQEISTVSVPVSVWVCVAVALAGVTACVIVVFGPTVAVVVVVSVVVVVCLAGVPPRALQKALAAGFHFAGILSLHRQLSYAHPGGLAGAL